MSDLPEACQRVETAAHTLGLAIEIKVLAQSSRTAEEAAAACNCDVGQIVKSLVFREKAKQRPVLLLVSGSNRVDEAKVADTLGEMIERPAAAFVRSVTGFAIGGIPPFGHAAALATYIDADLLKHVQVFAAAGTPNSIFAVDPKRLAKATRATVIAMC